MFIYATGKSDQTDSSLHSLVLHLMKELLDSGRKLYMDNYYNSPALAYELFQRQTNVVGTLRMNRKGVPKELSKQKLRRGEVIFRTSHPVTIIVWHDKRDVNIITTMHDASLVVVPNKFCKKTGQQIQKPKAIMDYNEHMGSVDQSDQMVLLNSSVRKTLKWTKKLFVHLLDLSATNAHILYGKHTGSSMKHFKFAKKLCVQLISAAIIDPDYGMPKKSGRRSSNMATRLQYSMSTHWPSIIPPTEKQSKPRRECVVCRSHRPTTGTRWKKGDSRVRVQTRYQCSGCIDQPALCVTPCFQKYHTLKHY